MKLICPVCRIETENTQLPEECNKCGTPLRSYMRLYTHAANLFNLGLAAAREGSLTKAREYFSAVVYWCPTDLEARNALGAACFELNDIADARHNWEIVLEKSPNDPVAKEGISSLDNETQRAIKPHLTRKNSKRKHKKKKKRKRR